MKTTTEAKPILDNDSAPAVFNNALAPMFVTDEQAAVVTGLTTHQLYLYRRRGGGPPFVVHGVRVRYPIDGLRAWAAELPRFSSRAEAYAYDPKRADGAARQRAALIGPRKRRHEAKEKAAAGERAS
jgi:hypothetical protein